MEQLGTRLPWIRHGKQSDQRTSQTYRLKYPRSICYLSTSAISQIFFRASRGRPLFFSVLAAIAGLMAPPSWVSLEKLWSYRFRSTAVISNNSGKGVAGFASKSGGTGRGSFQDRSQSQRSCEEGKTKRSLGVSYVPTLWARDCAAGERIDSVDVAWKLVRALPLRHRCVY